MYNKGNDSNHIICFCNKVLLIYKPFMSQSSCFLWFVASLERIPPELCSCLIKHLIDYLLGIFVKTRKKIINKISLQNNFWVCIETISILAMQVKTLVNQAPRLGERELKVILPKQYEFQVKLCIHHSHSIHIKNKWQLRKWANNLKWLVSYYIEITWMP